MRGARSLANRPAVLETDSCSHLRAAYYVTMDTVTRKSLIYRTGIGGAGAYAATHRFLLPLSDARRSDGDV